MPRHRLRPSIGDAPINVTRPENDQNISRVTIYDVAKVAGVSQPVVSTVLNSVTNTTIRVSQQTRERVQRVARQLNYEPSILGRSLAAQKSYVIGLLLSEVNSELAADVIRGVQDVASEHSYSPMVFIHGTAAEEATEFERSRQRCVDALIVDTFDAPACAANVERYRELARSGFPLVELFGASIPDVPRINVDFRGDGQRAVEHLVQAGHRRIALVVHDQYQQRPAHWAAWDFYSGYRAAMQAAGLKPTVVKAPAVSSPRDPYAFVESGRRAAGDLVAMAHRPTAIISFSNRRAYGLIQGLRAAGLEIPDDMSVVGYYGRDITLTDPPLTTMTVAARRAGQAAAQSVFGILEGEVGLTVAVESEWSMRGTVASIATRNQASPQRQPGEVCEPGGSSASIGRRSSKKMVSLGNAASCTNQ